MYLVDLMQTGIQVTQKQERYVFVHMRARKNRLPESRLAAPEGSLNPGTAHRICRTPIWKPCYDSSTLSQRTAFSGVAGAMIRFVGTREKTHDPLSFPVGSVDSIASIRGNVGRQRAFFLVRHGTPRVRLDQGCVG
jgi:hypothetical protein